MKESENMNKKIITDDKCDTVYVSSLMKGTEKGPFYDNLRNVYGKLKEIFAGNIFEMTNTSDVWARDYMPVQIADGNFWKFKYHPDYLTHDWDSIKSITDFRSVKAKGSELWNNSDISTGNEVKFKDKIIVDGGNVMKCDGFVIMTDKVLKENPGLTVSEIKKMIGVDVVIIPADANDPFGHADGMVRYLSPENILLRAAQNREDALFLEQVKYEILHQRPNLNINQFNFGWIKENDPLARMHNWCYINFLRVGNIVALPVLSGIYSVKRTISCEDDAKAKAQLQEFLPCGCTIVEIPVLDIVANEKLGGGALNCLTWTIKKFR